MGIFRQLKDEAGEGDDREVPAPAYPITEEEAAAPMAGTDDESGDEEARAGELSRRTFLGGSALVAGTAAAGYLVHGTGLGLGRPQTGTANGSTPHLLPRTATPPIEPYWDLFLQVERDTDLALMDFYFYGFEVQTGEFGFKSLLAVWDQSIVIVRLPPQSVAEAVYPTGSYTPPTPDPQPILSALSGPSQLSFSFAEGTTIPLFTMTYSDLLDWSGWDLNVPTVAQAPVQPLATGPFPGPEAPGAFDTFIEFPYCLYLAPSVYNPDLDPGWPYAFTTAIDNVSTPVTSAAGVTDLFTSAIVQAPAAWAVPGGPPYGMAAIWAVDLSDEIPGTILAEYYDQTPENEIFYGEAPT